MHDPAARRLEHDRNGVGDRVRHPHELDPELPQLAGWIVGMDLAQLGGAQQAVLIELRLDQAERESCRPDLRDVDLAHQIRQGADVVLVAVREDDRADRARAVAQVRKVGQDEVDAEVLIARKARPASTTTMSSPHS
jgi:hypothetical protein